MHIEKNTDGYASNVGQCVNLHKGKILGLKRHDCHILMQWFLPIMIRGYLNIEVWIVLRELSGFFQDLCSWTLKITMLHRLKSDIGLILFKLEKIISVVFFTIMVHLMFHLPGGTFGYTSSVSLDVSHRMGFW